MSKYRLCECITYVTTCMHACIFKGIFCSPCGLQERLKKQFRHSPSSASHERILYPTIDNDVIYHCAQIDRTKRCCCRQAAIRTAATPHTATVFQILPLGIEVASSPIGAGRNGVTRSLAEWYLTPHTDVTEYRLPDYYACCIYAHGGFVETHEAKQGEPWLFYFQVALQ